MSGWRRHILKAVLWSLAVAAVAGVLGVMVTSQVIWRVAQTGFVTAMAAGVLLLLLRVGDRRQMQAACAVGTAALAVEFLLILMMIWEAPRLAGVYSESLLTVTVFLVAASGGAAMIFLRLLQAPAGRWSGYVGLAQAGAFLVLGLLATWISRRYWSGVTAELWETAFAIAASGLLAAAMLVGVGTDRRHWRWAGVAASAAGLVSLGGEVWFDALFDEKIFAVLAATACFVAFANLVMRVPVKDAGRHLRTGTIAAGAATALASALIVFGLDPALMARLTAAAAILTACGTLALGVLARLNRRGDLESAPAALALVTLFCPRCTRKQALGLGGGRCAACGLRIDVRIEEPRCTECGYLLYKLTGDRCPECGTVIAGPPAEAA